MIRFPAIITALEGVHRMLDSQQDRGPHTEANPSGLTPNQSLCVARAAAHVTAAIRFLRLGLTDTYPPSDWPGPVH